VGLLLVASYWRACNLLDAEKSRPATTSTEALFELPDDASRSVEQELQDQELKRRVVEALSFLPARERKLVWLVTYEDMSIREAGRQVGWGKSSADRHYHAALDRLRVLLRDFDD
jgi:RNA polymerase sigma factor (sigma-70 family)